MIFVEQQVHGYRQGHQLLSSSVSLNKTDQSTVDQLSDVAGPLRPGELFEPYVSAYPLPSGAFYVLARTWQDLTVTRAGCVRTLSLLISMADWMSTEAITPFLKLLDSYELPTNAVKLEIPRTTAESLPPVKDFRGKELLEAMFLEEAKPIAVFDPPDPELVAVRLITALWPGIRKRFTLSTFALSPRKIDGRYFDLVFAPKDAKPRFSDWQGRRIDGGVDRDSRHRWTSNIFHRVFVDPHPRLMNEEEGSLVEFSENGSFASLRIALLWDELLEKVERSPTAALGLLDIAISRPPASRGSVIALTPTLRDATAHALGELSPTDAWDFVDAIVRKMHGVYTRDEIKVVALPAARLAAQDPHGAIELLCRPDPTGAHENLFPAIAEGIAQAFNRVELALADAPPGVLARLVSNGGKLAEESAKSPPVLTALTNAILVLAQDELILVRSALMPLLLDDNQAGLAEKFFATLDATELLFEVQHIGEASAFGACQFFRPIAARARQLGAIVELRHAILRFDWSESRDQFVAATLSASSEDALWLISSPVLTIEAANVRLLTVLQAASFNERNALLLDRRILSRVPDEGTDLLLWAVQSMQMPFDLYLETVFRLLPLISDNHRVQVALVALDKCLGSHFRGDESATLGALFEAASTSIDVRSVCRVGLNRNLAPDVLSRNVIAIDSTSAQVRSRFFANFDELAETLASRYVLDLSAEAASSCASLLWAAQSQHPRVAVAASGRLLPQLLRSTRSPVSIVVAAAFPIVYKELAAQDDVPEMLKFVPFIDWDKCKAARRELVDAFLSTSIWAPEDLALTAFLCVDIDRILGRIRKAYGGPQYLDQMLERSTKLPVQCREAVQAAAARLTSSRSD